VIDTANDLTPEQMEIVGAAVRVAGVTVRIEQSLGPGPDPSLPPVPVPWGPSTVGPDLRSLVVQFSGGPLVREAVVSVSETEHEVCVQVEHADPRSLAGTVTPMILITRCETVELRSPLRGRRITEPTGTPAWHGAQHWQSHDERAEWIRLIPRVLGLNPQDADRLLHDQELRPRHASRGPEIVAQHPGPDTPAETNQDVILTAGTST
jgi:hypothetical protein